MARIKLVYLGGGSTRGAGTMASFMANGRDFDGSEVVLVDLDPDRLELIRTLAEKMARARGLDIAVTATTDRRAALDGCDAVLSSFRPGGFAARVHDERIPLEHGVIGQETQGAGGFFMALRAITVLKDVCAEMEELCPNAWIFNYTNPVNIVAEAITHNSSIKIVSLCEGPIYFRDTIAESAGLDPALLDVTMVGLNHGCWGVEQSYDGQDPMPLLAEAWERRKDDPTLDPVHRRQLQLAVAMGAIPADYFQYYYFTDEVLAEYRAKPTTRAEDILGWSTDYWRHYEEQATSDDPQLDPARSRGGINELELAIDVMDAIFNDKDEVHPVNMPNAGGALPGFPDDLVVEVLGRCHAGGIDVLPSRPAASPRQGARRDARRVPGPRRGDSMERQPSRWHSRARREPARAPGRARRAALRRARHGAPPVPPRPAPRRLGAVVGTLLLGVDGGNTKTHALVTDGDGTVLGRGDAGTADIHNSEPEPALVEIVRACEEALAAAGASSSDLAAAAFSLAGADWPEDFVLLREELTRRLGLLREPMIVNDGIGPLRCGTEDAVGVAAVIGTYCAVGARNAAGEIFHLGFWPDSTGAYALGSEALAAIWRNMLGLAPPTSMLPRALELWNRSSAEDLLHVFTRIDDGLPAVAERARFAAAVLDEAEGGDVVARDIVRHVGGRAGDYARVSAERTGQLGEPFPLVLLGGVLRHPSPLLRAAIHDRVPESTPVYPDIEPVVGALLLAADSVGARPDRDRIRDALDWTKERA